MKTFLFSLIWSLSSHLLKECQCMPPPLVDIDSPIYLSPIIKEHTKNGNDKKNRLTSRLLYNTDHLAVDGTYQQCATLVNRLQITTLCTESMSWRHLWNYIAILLIALGTHNQSNATVMQWNQTLTYIIHRLRNSQLPGFKFMQEEYTHEYQVDLQMLCMVDQHLRLILVPPETQPVQPLSIPNIIRIHKREGTMSMFNALFEYWKTPIAVIQLLARSYLPTIYLLHNIHDAEHVFSHHLLTYFYIPLHQYVSQLPTFLELGNEEQFQIALTLVDLLSTNGLVTNNYSKYLSQPHFLEMS